MKNIFIYIGGQGPSIAPEISGDITATIAADSGLHLAHFHEIKVDLIVGDMDSVEAELLHRYESSGSHVSRFPHEKDETDFELAIMAAKNYIADKLVIIGGGGDRLDHLISNIAIAAGPTTESWEVEMFTQNETINFCRPGQPVNIRRRIGDEISLIPVGANAAGVTTNGAKWELENATLSAYSGRGISNAFEALDIDIKIEQGVLAVITTYEK